MSLPVDQIICGESLSTLKTFPDESVDIVFTSPPYNFGMDYDKFDDTDPYVDYLNTMNDIFSECFRVLKSGGRILINVAPSFPQHKPTHHHLTRNLVENCGMLWMGEIIWMKNNFGGGTAWGSWKSPSCPTLTRPYEFVCIYGKDSTKHTGKREDIDITGKEFLNYRNAHWTIQAEVQMRKKYDHPAMFPEELVYRALKMFSYQNDVILDPFNGAGTTSYVSKKLNRRFIGIDMDEKYCETARERLNYAELPFEFDNPYEDKPDEEELKTIFDFV